MIDEATQLEVDRLLALSRQEHERYLFHLPRKEPDPTQPGALHTRSGDTLEARARMKGAAQARMQADRIDPNHDAPAWTDEAKTHNHQALIMEYLDVLSR